MVVMDGVSVNYGHEPALGVVSASFEPGGIHGILGPNGGGKSTMLKVAAGLVRRASGSVLNFGLDPGLRSAESLADIAFVPDGVPPELGDPEGYARHRAPFRPAWDPVRYRATLDAFGIPAGERVRSRGFLPGGLRVPARGSRSHGGMKKVALAFALACGARILLLDEPDAGLDAASRRTLRSLLSEAAAEGKVVLLATHHLREYDSLLDTVTILDGGRLALRAGTAALSRSVHVERRASGGGSAPLWSRRTAMGHETLVAGPGDSLDLEAVYDAALENPEALAAVLSQNGGHR